MNNSKIFFSACLFFILGIFMSSVWAIDFFVLYLLAVLTILFFILTRQNKLFLILGFWCLAVLLGLGRYQLAEPEYSSDKIHFYNNQNTEFIGLVSQEADMREDRVRLEIKAQQVKLNEKWLNVSGRVLVTAFIYPEYKYGDRLKIICDLQQPEPIEDFNYDKYLSRYDIYSLCYYPSLTLLEKDQGNFFLAAIYKFKNFFTSRLNRALPEPQSSFLAGLLIGAKKSIPADLQAVFNLTGTTHIVAVSGYNVAIMAAFFMLLSQNIGLGRKRAFWLIIGFLIIFIIITGLQASIVRAGIMGGLVLLAGYLGRHSNVRNVLALAAVLMLLANPKILVYDLGFQLSFLATLGLIYLNPVLIKLTKIANCKFKIIKLILGDYFLTTMSAIIITQPLVLYQFGKISLIAPLANFLILPFIPLAMLLGFIAGLGAMIWTGLGWVLGWGVWLVLTYIIWVLEKLAGIEWSYWEVEKINVWLMVVLYLLIGGVIYWLREDKMKQKI